MWDVLLVVFENWIVYVLRQSMPIVRADMGSCERLGFFLPKTQDKEGRHV